MWGFNMMIEFLISSNGFQYLGIISSATAISGALVSEMAYRGKDGERYSPLNHFKSELGEVDVSRLAWVFNLGLMLNGFCLVPASISLGFILQGVLAKVGMAAGVVSGIGLFL
jgi:hypothetical membrane protein